MKREARRKKPEVRSGIRLLGFICLTSGFWLLPSGFWLHAEVIDRIVAVVDGHIITASDLRQEREIRARLADPPIEEDKALAKELTDTYLIEQQIGDYPNLDVTNDEVDADLRTSKARGDSITEAVRNVVRKRIRIQKFFDLKFADSIRPTDEQIRKYYSDFVVPAARAQGLDTIPPLSDSDMAKAVRDNVIQESLNHEVTVWLEAIRRRSNIEVFD